MRLIKTNFFVFFTFYFSSQFLQKHSLNSKTMASITTLKCSFIAFIWLTDFHNTSIGFRTANIRIAFISILIWRKILTPLPHHSFVLGIDFLGWLQILIHNFIALGKTPKFILGGNSSRPFTFLGNPLKQRTKYLIQSLEERKQSHTPKRNKSQEIPISLSSHNRIVILESEKRIKSQECKIVD